MKKPRFRTVAAAAALALSSALPVTAAQIFEWVDTSGLGFGGTIEIADGIVGDFADVFIHHPAVLAWAIRTPVIPGIFSDAMRSNNVEAWVVNGCVSPDLRLDGLDFYAVANTRMPENRRLTADLDSIAYRFVDAVQFPSSPREHELISCGYWSPCAAVPVPEACATVPVYLLSALVLAAIRFGKYCRPMPRDEKMN